MGLLEAGRAGRAGLSCPALYTGCEGTERNFLAIAAAFLYSPAGEKGALERLLAWASHR
jgi:hypothetical protein